MALSIGELVLDRYVVEGLIGQGGMGAVYRARHQRLGIPVAIKTITGDASEELVARFGREAQLLARVRHPNVVSILDVGDLPDNSPCMVMEFLEGEALDARIERRGALPWSEVRAIGLYVLQGLEAIHAAGIVHRDLKPANVLAVRGPPETIKLVDFGIAHSTGSDAVKYTRAGAMIGTPAYMSPEQMMSGELDARSDIYALGLLLYELANGQLPFGGEAKGALRRLREPVPPMAAAPALPPIPDAANAAVLNALDVDIDKRPANAKAFYALLHAARAPQSAGAAPSVVVAPPPTTSRAPQAQPTPPKAAAQPLAPPPPRPTPPTAAAAAPSMTQLSGPARALIAARLPVARMSREEQKALAQLAAPGRAYHLGGGVWLAILPGPSEDETKQSARNLGAKLQDRFGDSCKVVFTLAPSNFALTPASLSGAAPLPDEINDLLQHLS